LNTKLRNLFWAAVLFFSFSVPAFPVSKKSKCESWQSARDTFLKGNRREAISSLECEIKQNPKNLDAALLLSDLYWWNGETEESKAWAERVLVNSSYDFHTRRRLKNRTSRWSLSPTILAVSTQSSRGYEYNLDVGYTYSGKSKVSFGATRVQRTYGSASSLVDNSLQLRNSFPIQEKIYVEAEGSVSSQPTFLPNWRLALTPHYVIREGSDASLGIQLSHYSAGISPLLIRPGWTQSLGESLEANLSSFLTYASGQFLFAASTGAKYWLFSSTRLDGAFGFGDNFEAPGITDRYSLFALTANQWLLPQLRVSFTLELHRGRLRKETRIGSGIEWLF